MADEAMVERVFEQLFGEAEASVYAVLDGASIEGLLPALREDGPEHCCLYSGELEPDVEEAAPYLVRLDRGSPFTHWLIAEGWGKHWGIFALAKADLRAMRKHFRTFLMVRSPEGQPLYFRYYDPRVLRVYLPTCNAMELEAVFGLVLAYLAEAEKPQTMLRFVRKGTSLDLAQVALPQSAGV